jgi:hypothetical protein
LFRLGVAVPSPHLFLSFGYTKMGYVIGGYQNLLAGWERVISALFLYRWFFGFARI